MSSPDRVERVVKAVDLLSSRKRPHVDLEYEGDMRMWCARYVSVNYLQVLLNQQEKNQ